MKTTASHELKRAVMTAAVAAAFSPAYGQGDPEAVRRLAAPSSEISVGIGYVDEDNRRFGEYSGLRRDGAYGLVDLNVVRGDDAEGRWMRLDGRNLGLDSRRLRFEQERQGDWGYFLQYDAIPRYTPLTFSTGLAGIGTNSQTIGTVATPKSDAQLRTKRESLAAGFGKQLGKGLDLVVRFRTEDKNGSRPYGVYAPGPHFLAEPIDWTAQQWDATLGYASERFQLSGGYKGTRYENANAALNIAGVAITTPFMALPPSNESHQVHASGGFNFTRTTRGSFKVAYSRATQDERFIVPALRGQQSLDGSVDTRLMQFGLSTRPLPRLTLNASARYEDRDDRTPRTQYISAVSAVRSGFNNPRSFRSTSGKVEASYALPLGMRLSGGAEIDRRERTVPELRSVPYRKETEDTTYRLELRRSLAETLTGALAFVHDKRTGSEVLRDTYAPGTAGSNVVMPLHWNDRSRNRWRATVNWVPMETLSIDAVLEDSSDKYRNFDTFQEGLHRGDSRFVSLDASYALTEDWQITGWVSRSDVEAFQTTQTGTPGALWSARLGTIGNSYGIGLRGRPSERLEIGTDLNHSYNRNTYRLSGTPVTAQIPDYYFKLTTLKLFAKYALSRQAGVRVDFVHDLSRTDDWTWNNFVYPEGTRAFQNGRESVNFIGLTAYYNF